jgi:hypothetical protein
MGKLQVRIERANQGPLVKLATINRRDLAAEVNDILEKHFRLPKVAFLLEPRSRAVADSKGNVSLDLREGH